MRESLTERCRQEIAGFREQGVYKRLNHLDGPQSARVPMEGRGTS